MILWLASGVLTVGVLLLTGLEVRGWKTGARQINRRQKVYRIAAAVVVEVIIIMVFLHIQSAKTPGAIAELRYWSVVTAFVLALPALALLDIRETLVAYRARRKDVLRSLIDEEARKQ